MSKKIKVELTEKQYMAMTMALESHVMDMSADEFLDHQNATEIRVIQNGIRAMGKGYKEWEMNS